MVDIYDVIVVGGGHAGMEAAWAAARMGARTLLVSLSKKHIGLMPCNPSVGGLGKGHIVYEVSALGGLMPKLCSQAYLQARMLNTRKGPAVQGLRLQIDKYKYKRVAQEMLDKAENLEILEGRVEALLFDDSLGRRVTGVRVKIDNTSSEIAGKTVIVTAGTFLNGVLHTGDNQVSGGRVGEAAVKELSQSLSDIIGAKIGRLKTGTPPRILTESIDFSKLERQEAHHLEYLYEFERPEKVEEKLPCYIAYTNEKTHEIISENLTKSAMYSGNITGVGPRYCPSIEDKVGRYPDRMAHHVFIEPEGEGIDEIYPSGLSTSLPVDIQERYMKSMVGFENCTITKPGYAVEYDFIQPTVLTHSLETKTVSGLFFAGQINGTTGYEEAAGQGILAGINGALKSQGKEPFVLDRAESYVGVMVDDLVTLGVDEPYRMFTSRAERRLLLRQDNVFERLMPYGKKLGLISDDLYKKFEAEQSLVNRSKEYIFGTRSERERGCPKNELYQVLQAKEFTREIKEQVKSTLAAALSVSETSFTSRLLLQVYAACKYDGYLEREEKEVIKMKKYRTLSLPDTFNFDQCEGLSFELKIKLKKHKPETLAQAALIPGMTPAALSLLLFYLRKR